MADRTAKGRDCLCGGRSLLPEQYDEIKASNEPTSVLARRYGVDSSLISYHRGVSNVYVKAKLTDAERVHIRVSTDSAKDCAARFNISAKHVYKLRSGER